MATITRGKHGPQGYHWTPQAGFVDFFFPNWEQYRVPGERILYYERRHVIALIRDTWEALLIAFGAAILLLAFDRRIAGPLFDVGVGAISIGAFAYVLTKLVAWSVTRVIVTDRRLVELGGFIDVRFDNLPNSKLTDLAFRQTFWGKFFNYGQVRVETAGQDQALGTIRFLRSPQRFLQELGERTLR